MLEDVSEESLSHAGDHGSTVPWPHASTHGMKGAIMNYRYLSMLCLALTASSLALTTAGCTQHAANPQEGDEVLAPGNEATEEASQALLYACTLGVNCGAPTISLLSNTNGSTYRVNMSSYRRLDLFASICNPTGWAMHLTDSPSANGYGGDGASTDHDAEGYLIGGSSLEFYSAYDMTRILPGAYLNKRGAFPGGCSVVRMAAFHDAGSPDSTFQFVGDISKPEISTEVSSLHGMKIGYTSCSSSTSSQRSIECDYENRSLSDQNYWYIGINRTVGSSSRTGTGVQRACVVLNSDASVTPASCL
jgi:hypothetical protein